MTPLLQPRHNDQAMQQAQRPLACHASSRAGYLRQATPCRRNSAAAATADRAVEAEQATKSGWDPEGLLDTARKPAGGSLLSDHSARRAARRRVQLPDADQLTDSQVPQLDGQDVPAGLSRTSPPADQSSGPQAAQATHGRVLADDSRLRAELANVLQQQYWPLELDRPGLEVLHLDPPILRLPDFLDQKICDSLMGLAAAGGEPEAMLCPGKLCCGFCCLALQHTTGFGEHSPCWYMLHGTRKAHLVWVHAPCSGECACQALRAWPNLYVAWAACMTIQEAWPCC